MSQQDSRESILVGLRGVEKRENVRVVYACEIGSHAQGLARKSSDWDVRFFFVYPVRRYLSLMPVQEIVNTSFDEGRCEVQGRELRNALSLLRGSNLSIVEQLTSQVVYVDDHNALSGLMGVLAKAFSQKVYACSCLSMAKKNLAALMGGRSAAKDHINVLRPVLAVRWMERFGTPANVDFIPNIEKLDLVPDLIKIFDKLAECKRNDVPVPGELSSPIQLFVSGEIARLEPIVGRFSSSNWDVSLAAADVDNLFCSMLEQAWDVEVP